MKKGLIVAMAFAVILTITGCKNIGNLDAKTGEPVIGEPIEEASSSHIYDKDDVIMNAEKDTYPNSVDEITLTIDNKSADESYYGVDFTLEQEVDSEWVLVSPKEDIFVIEIAYILESNGNGQITSNLSPYGELEDGHYRIVKNVVKQIGGEDEGTSQAENYNLAAEFNIGSTQSVTAKEEPVLGELADTTDWKPTNYKIVNDLDGVTMSVKKATLSANGLTVMFQNESDKTCLYGEMFVLEKKIGELWYEVPVVIKENYGFESIGYEVPSGQNNEWDVDWKWLYGSLNPGEYRIVKEVSDIRKTRDYNVFVLTAEFTLANE